MVHHRDVLIGSLLFLAVLTYFQSATSPSETSASLLEQESAAYIRSDRFSSTESFDEAGDEPSAKLLRASARRAAAKLRSHSQADDIDEDATDTAPVDSATFRASKSGKPHLKGDSTQEKGQREAHKKATTAHDAEEARASRGQAKHFSEGTKALEASEPDEKGISPVLTGDPTFEHTKS
ncbi:hypothetical protein CYMTET_27647 [Cymbomonas tetramitiformis]|uniref:Uncharacterized protein n=1 Tax=Cymbomonas tetramitiformis TaxID=36881 RepID=A0AAE0FPY9_9CHLO|nr:hypothetical protein CYMTET_27647 [Cymbomonas tetramitiformis]|eukprot:gene7146-8521_t